MKFDLLPLDVLRKRFSGQKLILTEDFWLAMFNAVDEINETPNAETEEVRGILEFHHLHVGDTEPADLTLIGNGIMGFQLPDGAALIVTRVPSALIEQAVDEPEKQPRRKKR